MTERKRSGTKKLEKLSMNPKTPMTKEQKEVTAWLKEHVPTKKTKFLHSHVVDYFSGAKAIDLLMSESKWASKGKGEGGISAAAESRGLVGIFMRALRGCVNSSCSRDKQGDLIRARWINNIHGLCSMPPGMIVQLPLG